MIWTMQQPGSRGARARARAMESLRDSRVLAAIVSFAGEKSTGSWTVRSADLLARDEGRDVVLETAR